MRSVEQQSTQEKLVHPSWRTKKVWTTKRKVLGNLLPALLALPFAVAGVWIMYDRLEVFGLGLVIFAISPVMLWLGMNFFGLYQNKRIRLEMELKMRAIRTKLPVRRFFVGAARPSYKGLLDPHEDVGFLILHPEKLEFFGDKFNVTLDRSEITEIRFRPNVHTLVGLGRWVSIEGLVDKVKVRLLVEVRDRQILLSNLLLSKALKKRIQQWTSENSPSLEGEGGGEGDQLPPTSQ